jgi:glyoxylase-like metal-dependent hydrolase (beta-lactamase superfamily II)
MNATDDWYDIDRLSDHSYRLTEGGVFGTFLIVGDERALQVDAGGGFGDLRGAVDGLVEVPVSLLLTHSHWDHMGAAHQFESVRVHDRERTADGRVTTDVVTDEFGYGPADFIADWKAAGESFPDGFDAETFEIPPAAGVEAAEPGETVDLGGRELELVGVPGHSPGQLAVLDRADGVLYGADLLHRDHDLYIHFEGCDIHKYVETLRRVRDLHEAGAFDTLHVSHAHTLSGEELGLVDDYLEGLQAILDGERGYELTEEEPQARRYEVAGHAVLTKPDVV